MTSPDQREPQITRSETKLFSELDERQLAQLADFAGLDYDPSRGSLSRDAFKITLGKLPRAEIDGEITSLLDSAVIIKRDGTGQQILMAEIVLADTMHSELETVSREIDTIDLKSTSATRKHIDSTTDVEQIAHALANSTRQAHVEEYYQTRRVRK